MLLGKGGAVGLAGTDGTLGQGLEVGRSDGGTVDGAARDAVLERALVDAGDGAGGFRTAAGDRSEILVQGDGRGDVIEADDTAGRRLRVVGSRGGDRTLVDIAAHFQAGSLDPGAHDAAGMDAARRLVDDRHGALVGVVHQTQLEAGDADDAARGHFVGMRGGILDLDDNGALVGAAHDHIVHVVGDGLLLEADQAAGGLPVGVGGLLDGQVAFIDAAAEGAALVERAQDAAHADDLVDVGLQVALVDAAIEGRAEVGDAADTAQGGPGGRLLDLVVGQVAPVLAVLEDDGGGDTATEAAHVEHLRNRQVEGQVGFVRAVDHLDAVCRHAADQAGQAAFLGNGARRVDLRPVDAVLHIALLALGAADQAGDATVVGRYVGGGDEIDGHIGDDVLQRAVVDRNESGVASALAFGRADGADAVIGVAVLRAEAEVPDRTVVLEDEAGVVFLRDRLDVVDGVVVAIDHDTLRDRGDLQRFDGGGVDVGQHVDHAVVGPLGIVGSRHELLQVVRGLQAGTLRGTADEDRVVGRTGAGAALGQGDVIGCGKGRSVDGAADDAGLEGTVAVVAGRGTRHGGGSGHVTRALVARQGEHHGVGVAAAGRGDVAHDAAGHRLGVVGSRRGHAAGVDVSGGKDLSLVLDQRAVDTARIDRTGRLVGDLHRREVDVVGHAEREAAFAEDTAGSDLVGVRGRVLDRHGDRALVGVAGDDVVLVIVLGGLLEADDAAGALPVAVRFLLQGHGTLVGAVLDLAALVEDAHDAADTDDLEGVREDVALVGAAGDDTAVVVGTDHAADAHPGLRSNLLPIGNIRLVVAVLNRRRGIDPADKTTHVQRQGCHNGNGQADFRLVGAVLDAGRLVHVADEAAEVGHLCRLAGSGDDRLVDAAAEHGVQHGVADEAADAHFSLGRRRDEVDLHEGRDILQRTVVDGDKAGMAAALAFRGADDADAVIRAAVLRAEDHILDGAFIAEEETGHGILAFDLEVEDLVALAVEGAGVLHHGRDGRAAHVDVVEDLRHVSRGEIRGQGKEGLEIVRRAELRSRRDGAGRGGLGDVEGIRRGGADDEDLRFARGLLHRVLIELERQFARGLVALLGRDLHPGRAGRGLPVTVGSQRHGHLGRSGRGVQLLAVQLDEGGRIRHHLHRRLAGSRPEDEGSNCYVLGFHNHADLIEFGKEPLGIIGAEEAELVVLADVVVDLLILVGGVAVPAFLVDIEDADFHLGFQELVDGPGGFAAVRLHVDGAEVRPAESPADVDGRGGVGHPADRDAVFGLEAGHAGGDRRISGTDELAELLGLARRDDLAGALGRLDRVLRQFGIQVLDVEHQLGAAALDLDDVQHVRKRGKFFPVFQFAGPAQFLDRVFPGPEVVDEIGIGRMGDDDVVVLGPIDITLHGVAFQRHRVFQRGAGIVRLAAFGGAAAVGDDLVRRLHGLRRPLDVRLDIRLIRIRLLRRLRGRDGPVLLTGPRKDGEGAGQHGCSNVSGSFHQLAAWLMV